MNLLLWRIIFMALFGLMQVGREQTCLFPGVYILIIQNVREWDRTKKQRGSNVIRKTYCRTLFLSFLNLSTLVINQSNFYFFRIHPHHQL